MKFTTAQLVLLAGSALAVPVVEAPSEGALFRRELNKRGLTDADILNFALTLEHLEATFYAEGLSKFNQQDFTKYGSGPHVRTNVVELAADEATHVSFLTSALTAAGASPVAACDYNFGLTDVNSFARTASVLEGVGVSAYLGAAASIAEPAYLTAAGSILTVEARHNAYIRNSLLPPQSPFPAPFDVPLTPNQAYTLASPFIVSCPPSNAPLPVKAFPALTFGPKNPNPVPQGMLIGLFAKSSLANAGQLYCAWPNVAGTAYTKVTEVDSNGLRAKCTVPSVAAGQSYAILTTSPNNLTDDNTVAGPAIVPVLSPYLKNGFPSS